jgi:hypothetical protein
MKLKGVFFLFVLLFTLGTLAAAEPRAGTDVSNDARAAQTCDYSVGCNCVDSHSGLYCGYCAQVRGNWVWDSVYQCNPNGDCCSFGYRGSCHNYDGPCG